MLRLSHGFLHDDLVQCATEINLNFIKNAVSFNLTSLFEVFGGCGHVQDSVCLFSVKLGELLLWHVVDKKIVADLRICINALAVSLGNTLCKNSWVLRVE